MIAPAGSLCAFAAIVALSQGYVRDDHVLHPKNDSMLSSNTNGTGKTSNIHIAEFFDPQKRIMARKNEMTGECILKLVDDHTENSNIQNNYDSKMELSGNEMIEIIGENINDFCGNNVIVLNNFDDDGRLNRSKRSTDKKRYQGQTQTQFVSFGSKDSNQQTKNGLAEAVSQPDLSRATVSGLNGMGQAQSQSSFGDCDECTGQNYRTHPTHAGNSYPSTYPGSEINNNAPSKQGQGYGTGPSVSGQYPNIYPGSGINNIVPGKQDQGFGTGPPANGQHPNIYPGSGINNIVPGKQDQGFGTGPPANGQHPNIYPGSGINNIVPGKQDQGFGTGPPANGQHSNIYPDSGINNIVPGKQDQGFGTGPPANGQHPNIYPGSGINNIVPGKQDQGFGTGPPANGQHPNTYPGSGINNIVPGKQDQRYVVGSTVGRQYPGTYPGLGINNRVSDKQNQGDNRYLNNQYSHTHSDLGNHKLPGKLDQGYEQSPTPFNINSHEFKKPENTGEINQNIYSGGSGPVNPSFLNYQNKLTSNPSNQQMYPDGSGFPSFPSGSAQGILAPHNTPNNFDLTNPSTNTIIPVTTSIEYQNIPTNYPPSQLTNYPHQVSTGLNQITPVKPISGVSNSQNLQKNVNEVIGSPSIMQNGYPFLWNTQGSHGFTQLNLPSLCNYLYQTCLNALSNNNKLNKFQMTPGLQNTERNSNDEKQYERIVPSSEQPASYPLYGERVNPNIVQSIYGQPQSSLGAGGSGVQQPVYIPSGVNINPNQIQPGYGQPQGSLDIGGPGVQQSGYTQSGGNINPNQIQSGYGQPQGSLGTGGLGVQQSGYTQSGGNVNPNQIQSGYGHPRGSLGTGGPGLQQPGYAQTGGNVNPNQAQLSYGQPQGSLSAGGSGVQQLGYIPSGGSISPNQIQLGYGQPQGSLGIGTSGGQRPGYISSGGSISPNQIHLGYGQPQGSLGTATSGVQHPGYISSGGSISPNQIQTGYGQPQDSLSTGGSGVQQPGHDKLGGNVSPHQTQLGYGQPQGSLGTGTSGVQHLGYISSGGSISPNQIQSGYGQPQGSLGTGGSGVQKPGYTQSGDVYQNGPSSFQSALDGKNTPGNYPESYGDNNYRGQQFGPGPQTGNNYLTSNPITGGQFGTDVSSGGSVTPIDTEGGDAQSMTNVNVDGKETSASASAQGKSKSGMTQTQVSGSYSGTGTFTAQAQTSDSDKGAQSRIVSNTNGTTSAAQGRGGKGQAQSQVLYNAESGIAVGESQSSGINYGTNAQLQAGVKGGVADAQSTGPGSTSSQAQIGFLPHESNNDTDQKSLFKGGGAASSQGGSYDGQSQSQLFGSYKHGISYNGAAQASSGKKLQNLPRLNLDGAQPKAGRRDDASNNETKVKTIPSPTPSSTVDDHADRRDVPSKRAPPPSVSPAAEEEPDDDNDSEYDEDGDYEDEDAVNTKSAGGATTVSATASPGISQTQNIVVNVDGKHDAHVTRDADGRLTAGQVLDAGQTVPGTDGARIPDGFRGRVVSVAGDRTGAAAVPGGRAQTQTVLLTPGAGGLTVVDKAGLGAMLAKESYVGPAGSGSRHGRFRADAEGETGKFRPGDRDVQYFTKSSTCGYFSFSCNYVDGAKSGPKICKPNQPPFPCQRTDRTV